MHSSPSELLLFFVHEPQTHKGRCVIELNCSRNCYDFRFCSSATTVQFTITSNLVMGENVSGKEQMYEKSL